MSKHRFHGQTNKAMTGRVRRDIRLWAASENVDIQIDQETGWVADDLFITIDSPNPSKVREFAKIFDLLDYKSKRK